MSEISFHKSKRDINLPNPNTSEHEIQAKVANSLYIIKDGNNKGKIYFDYDENTRLEIGSNDNVLYYEYNTLNNIVIIAQKSNFYTLNNNGSKSRIVTPYNELEVNKIVATPYSIYIIKEIGPSDNLTNSQVRLVKLYEPQKLSWNDYFINNSNNTSIAGDAIAGISIVGN